MERISTSAGDGRRGHVSVGVKVKLMRSLEAKAYFLGDGNSVLASQFKAGLDVRFRGHDGSWAFAELP